MIKLWDHKLISPWLYLDLGNAVGDVSWSPYSSIIFSAVTSDGKIHLYDLCENKHDPLCVQKVVKRARLSKVWFNSKEFILIVGDDKGGVNSLKLSPNLRNLYRPSGNDSSVGDTYDDIQRDKMKNLIAILDAKSEYKAKG